MLLTITTEKGNTVDVDVAVDELDLCNDADCISLGHAVAQAVHAAMEADAEDEDA